jgi:hypothetical protein
MPLNGTKIRELSEHALSVLGRVTTSPEPTSSVNPGVVRRLRDEGLAEIVSLPSPYASHKGKRVPHLKATDAGRQRLEAGRRAQRVVDGRKPV